MILRYRMLRDAQFSDQLTLILMLPTFSVPYSTQASRTHCSAHGCRTDRRLVARRHWCRRAASGHGSHGASESHRNMATERSGPPRRHGRAGEKELADCPRPAELGRPTFVLAGHSNLYLFGAAFFSTAETCSTTQTNATEGANIKFRRTSIR